MIICRFRLPINPGPKRGAIRLVNPASGSRTNIRTESYYVFKPSSGIIRSETSLNMRNSKVIFRLILLSAVAFSPGLARGYNSTPVARQAPVSAAAKYLAACCETETAALLAPRAYPVRQLHIYPRRLPAAHGTAFVGATETNHLSSIAAMGDLPFTHAVPITPHTLFSLSCLLRV